VTVHGDGDRLSRAGPLLGGQRGGEFCDAWAERRAPAWAPDGRQYAVAAEGRLRLWDGHTGEYQGSLPLPSNDGTFAITYQRDSRSLLVASTSGSTWTADTRVDQWDDRACAVAGRNLSIVEWKRFFPNTSEPTCRQWAPGT
jgi:hypothetical protein